MRSVGVFKRVPGWNAAYFAEGYEGHGESWVRAYDSGL
jgi:hypothetical protein